MNKVNIKECFIKKNKSKKYRKEIKELNKKKEVNVTFKKLISTSTVTETKNLYNYLFMYIYLYIYKLYKS